MADFSNQRICSFFPKSDFKVQIVPLSSQPPTYLTHRYSSSGLCASPPEGWSEGRVSSCLKKKINFIINIFSTKPISLFLITVLQALFPSVALNHTPNSYFQFLLLPPAQPTCHVQSTLDQKRHISNELACALRVAEPKERTKGLLVSYSNLNSSGTVFSCKDRYPQGKAVVMRNLPIWVRVLLTSLRALIL